MNRPTLIRIGLAMVALVALRLPLALAQQREEKFTIRLSPVPRDLQMAANVGGDGSATAVLVGSRLTITGSFKGLRSPATIAQLRRGSVTGVRGAASKELIVSKSTSGTIAGSVDLSPSEIEGLQKGQFYVQIHSEKAPDGNLWGWLLK